MKKFSVIVLAIALVMMMSVPFSVSAEDTAALNIPNVEVEVGTETVDVVVNYETTGKLLDGGIVITYPTDKLELVVREAEDEWDDPANELTTMPNGEVKIDAENGTVRVAFMQSTPIKEQTGTVVTLKFKLLDTTAEGDIEISAVADRLVIAESGNASGNNLVTEDNNFATTGKIVVKAKATQAPTQAPTEAPTQAPTQAPTKAPAPTGEATPWALLATVTVAGAALVVLSTKKSK